MIKKYLKRGLIFIGILAITLILWYLPLIGYGLAQARGQFSILWQAREVEEVLADTATSQELREKLLLVQKIRRYAMNELGLKNSDNYTTFYDQGGQPILWVVTASDRYALKPYEWRFPVVGTVPYKGFFEIRKAERLAEELRTEGYDVSMREVSGWSTLGWFRDPILSEMLNRPEGSLAELIVHELTHATIFVKDSITFNENLASFIGYHGALNYLTDTYGSDSPQYREYTTGREDSWKWSSHFIRGAEGLDSLYGTFTDIDTAEMKVRKIRFITAIVNQVDTINFNHADRYEGAFSEHLPNNAWFLSFLRYRGDNDTLERLLEEDYNSDLILFINEMKKKYPYL